MTDRASAEELREAARAMWYVHTEDQRFAGPVSADPYGDFERALLAALRDTGPRPDSGGDIDALLAEADRRVTALQYDVKNARMRQGIGMGADIYRDVIARLSAPRTETSVDWTEGHGTVARPRTETSDTVRIGSKTYLAGADDD